MKIFRRIVRNLVVTLWALFALAWAGTAYLHYPNPVASARLGLAMPSATVNLIPAHKIRASQPVALASGTQEQLPTDVVWASTVAAPMTDLQPLSLKTRKFSQFLTDTKTNAFLVVRHGKVTYEWYAPGVTKRTLLPSYSVAKSVVGILAGQAIAAGKLKESDTFVSMFPQYKSGTSFDRVTLGQLLDMKGGVGVSDDYPSGPSGWLLPIAQLFATNDVSHFISAHHSMFYAPGTKAVYRSIDAQLAGMMVNKAMGMSLADQLSKNVFPQMGAEFDGSWSVDHKGGYEKSFCCLNLTARDYAKFGELFVNAGVGPNGRVIDPVWFKRLSQPAFGNFGDNKWGYGAFVWHPTNDTSFFTGLNGQYVLAVPSTGTVVVKLSDDIVGGVTVQSFNVMNQIARISNP